MKDNSPMMVVFAVWAALAVFLSGISARRVELYNDPEKLWKDAYRHQPDSITVNLSLAALLSRSGQVQKAVEYDRRADELLRRAVEAHPDVAMLTLYGGRLRRAGRFEEAVATLQDALAIAPRSGTILNNLGMALVESGRPEGAIARFREAVEIVPDDFEVRASLAVAYARAGQGELAMTEAKRAIGLAKMQGNSELATRIQAWLNSYRKSVP